jgi:ABC-2 type transport system ATP-binding protein
MTGRPIISAEDLTKRYGSTEALSGLSFEVREGEIFGFIGANGAGKTTTLRILAGLSRPDEGWAEVDGVDVVGGLPRLHGVIGYMPDFFGVYDSMTASEYLTFYASCYRVDKHLTARVVNDLLELVALSSKRDMQVNSLSRGMKQRLCLARALVHDPKVLLLDEPASGLDPRARTEMRELVSVLQEMGKTIVLSSHILPELAEMCSSYGVIHNGRMVASGPADAILSATRPSGVAPIRARARVQGDLEEAERLAGAVAGVVGVQRVGLASLDIEYAGAGTNGELTDAATLLRGLVSSGIPVADFRTDDGGLEQLFLQLTEPAATGPATTGPATTGPATTGPAPTGPLATPVPAERSL